MYSVRDSLRPLIAWGYNRLQTVPVLQPNLNLEDLYLAVLLASKKLGVRLRPEVKGGESFAAETVVEKAINEGDTESEAGLLNLCMEMRNEFSDSRQVAARLAPNLQMYSVRDSLRPLIAWGYNRLQTVPVLQPNLNLEDLYLAVLLASKKLGVRLRPEVKGGESFAAETVVEKAINEGDTESEAGLLNLCMEMRNERPPEALLDNVITTVQDRFLGFEALALASIIERSKHTVALENMPTIPDVAETPEAKVGLARAWLRCWQNNGFWLSAMPPVWWRRPRSEGTSIRGQKGKFKGMDTILEDNAARKLFWDKWSPALLSIFAQDSDSGFKRLRGSELSLLFGGEWVHCPSCKSVHRPVPGLPRCLDCGSEEIANLDPDSDPVFLARKGFYRKPVMEALGDPPRQPMALIAAEHTAQLNAPQNEDIFSKAEENELLFQDIALTASAGGSRSTAIDILSSTTTMEVGIDLGALSGVALRNMPPGRANYQQRSGRAGRRGNAFATVVAFGSADSHDGNGSTGRSATPAHGSYCGRAHCPIERAAE